MGKMLLDDRCNELRLLCLSNHGGQRALDGIGRLKRSTNTRT